MYRTVPLLLRKGQIRFHSFEEFQAGCDSKGDLYDVLGHMKLVNGQCLTGPHGPVVKLYLGTRLQETSAKIQIIRTHPHRVIGDGPLTPRVSEFLTLENFLTISNLLLVVFKWVLLNTTGTLALTTMSSSRVFMDCDVQPTVDYLAEVVTKRETLTIGKYSPTSGMDLIRRLFLSARLRLMMWSMVHLVRAQISVYDNSEQAVFVLLGDAGFELTGKHAAELVSSYFEANGDQGVTQEVPFPEALISTIGQKHNFCVKVTQHNLDGKSRSLTVTKILPMESPPVTEASGGNYNPTTLEEDLRLEQRWCEASKISGDSAEGSKSNGDIDEMGKAKRLKRGV
ncbi:LOW QUALITY PROTEIN: hypothetical protein HID58_018404 [Brassica napus]|uniref:Uncharacterized protein n=1 Tax=Brassica napus TaxID=3708 RepID=A0ABQ8DAB3_BRANA|nr:LOW QUALITY PROTEIN: hypothetical protein HID58_018404 [Brassica napus]